MMAHVSHNYPPLPEAPPPPPEPPVAPPPPPPAPPAPPAPPRREAANGHAKRPSKPAPRHAPHASTSGRTSSAPQTHNRLRRETPFIASIRFRNELPEIPVDPKMLIRSLHLETMAAYKLTQAERALRPELMSLQFPSAIDIQEFEAPLGAPASVQPEDAQLLLDGSNKAKATVGKDGQLSWLLKTRYMQARDDMGENARLREAQEAEPPARPTLTRDAVVAHIEETFQAAKRPPVNPKDRNLVPVEVMPVLPDIDCWVNDYATTLCDSEMVTTVDFPKLGKRQRDFLTEHALMKPYTYPDRDENIDFIAHVVPRQVPSEDELARESHPDPVEGEYDWSREYSYRRDKTADGTSTYVVMLQGKQATYMKVNNAFVLGKRRRKEMLKVPIPAQITVSQREATDAEAATHRSKINQLYGVDDAQVDDRAPPAQPGGTDDLFSDEEDA